MARPIIIRQISLVPSKMAALMRERLARRTVR
jgi:hypothetical protein